MVASSSPSPLYPSDPSELREVEQLEELFSRKLGVWARVVAYHHLFSMDPAHAVDTLAAKQGPPASGPDPRAGSSRGSGGLPGWQVGFVRACLPLLRGAISKGYRVNAENAATCLKRIREVFDQVGERLSRNGSRGYLVGGRFSAADLTFAALAAPLLLPPAYGAYLPPLEACGPDHPGTELRRTPAGQHAMRMYELHREPPAGGPAAAAAVAAGSGAAAAGNGAAVGDGGAASRL
ncbi:hypothetical protein GPECTOR_12g448 [Gonium pectorale]|uniref:Glutathione S-transferase C-terminal domain-containing protein n=1 Tax=Gonium pectorale TaxID=33097 RepID=A0A150GNX3_GONPE|nr:hypothetical protein GPECTOR_12g448 [Gonium pectorale]|eukprot:KXZ51485.1 hypothetical protein GPECTOR_12g448 [Gonium pectorale]